MTDVTTTVSPANYAGPQDNGAQGAAEPQPASLAEAMAFYNAQYTSPTEDWTDECEKCVRTAWRLEALYLTALDQWDGSTRKHPVNGTPDWEKIPRGVPLYFQNSDPDGHICTNRGVLAEGPRVWTTDLPETGRVGTVSPDYICEKWGMKFLGWTEDVEGVVIPYAKPSLSLEDHPDLLAVAYTLIETGRRYSTYKATADAALKVLTDYFGETGVTPDEPILHAISLIATQEGVVYPALKTVADQIASLAQSLY